MKFVGIVGSNAELSYNRKLLQFIQREFKLKFELEVLEIRSNGHKKILSLILLRPLRNKRCKTARLQSAVIRITASLTSQLML